MELGNFGRASALDGLGGLGYFQPAIRHPAASFLEPPVFYSNLYTAEAYRA